ncbi:MAG TPA: ZIP family metal transporter [Candidatus Bathyarchaeia archaeon]|nr:ZIP family metal transporter [Candidatus Bathyarchaeia archaeon]
MANVLFAAFIGLVAGVIPVYLGLIPTPLFRRATPSRRNLLVSFSVGVLLFLFVDVTSEANTLGKTTVFGPALFLIGLVLGVGGPAIVSHRRRLKLALNPPVKGVSKDDHRMFTAYMIALGIGMHNFGEGLALGAAYAAGALGLTTILVIGFAIHNATEGMGITGPISDFPMDLRDPFIMGFIAGFPTLAGSIIGSLAYSEQIGSLFFAAAGGALLYVIIELLKISYSPKNTFIGVTVGMILMYLTGLLLPI